MFTYSVFDFFVLLSFLFYYFFQYGLYSSFVGTFVYLLFGTSKVVPMGPTAIVALLSSNSIGNRGPAYATLLCFLTGVVQALMSFTGLGIVVDFISVPVCSGFTSASAILIITSQLNDLIGVRVGGGNLFKMYKTILEHIACVGIGDTAMGFVCIVTVMLLKVNERRVFECISTRTYINWIISINKYIA